jgi:hypothetical protein
MILGIAEGGHQVGALQPGVLLIRGDFEQRDFGPDES